MWNQRVAGWIGVNGQSENGHIEVSPSQGWEEVNPCLVVFEDCCLEIAFCLISEIGYRGWTAVI